jgi:glycerol-3-phosphate acyltransferase PlsY
MIFLEKAASKRDFCGVTFYFYAAVLAYFLGSIPWGYLAGKIKGVDLRKEGSGSTGATNALRVLGKKWGYTVFALDAFKGWLSVMASFYLAKQIFHAAEPEIINTGVIAAIFSVIGHSYPVWLGFKGGKGIASSAGIMLALFPPAVFSFGLAVWLALFYGTRYVSVASIGAAIALPTASGALMILGQCDAIRTSIAGAMCILALWRHKSNIQRLRAGTEKRFEKKTASNV